MDYVNLSELKLWVRDQLPRGDALRVAIESQPDRVTVEELVVLFKAWDLMLATR